MSEQLNSDAVKIKNNYFDGLKVTKKHLFLFIIIASSYFFEQFDNANFAFIAPSFMAAMNIGTQQIAKINSLYFLAMSIGGLTGGIISDLIGRRKTLIISCFVFSIGSILSGAAPNLLLFIIARTITGFGIMCMMVVSIAYMAELSPKESRGRWEALISGIGYLSIPVVGVICRIALPLHPEAWRFILYAGGLGLVAGFLGLYYIKESPRWLVSKGRVAEAEEVVFDLSGVRVDLSEVKAGGKREPLLKVMKEMFSHIYLRRTLVLIIALWGNVICAQTLTAWNTTLLKLSGYTIEDSIVLAALFTIGIPLGQFTAAYFSDKGGRKIPISVFSTLAGLMAIVFIFSKSSFYGLAIAGLLVQIFSSARAFIIHPYVAESYPTKIRNSATGILNGTARFAAAGMQLVIPIIFAGFGIGGIYGFIAIMGITMALVVAAFGWRSANRSLEDINDTVD